jgi:hypothetical protein
MLKIVNLLQVTRSVDTDHGQLSAQEKKTVEAIVISRHVQTSMSVKKNQVKA